MLQLILAWVGERDPAMVRLMQLAEARKNPEFKSKGEVARMTLTSPHFRPR